MADVDEITGIVIDAAYRIHTGLGPGLLESVYEAVLARDLERQGLQVERQWPVSFVFDGMVFEDGFRVDLLVAGTVAVELKSVEQTIPIHGKQLLTYLRLMNLSVGLLINFGAPTLKEGLKRIVNNYSPASTGPSHLRVNERRGSRGDAESGRDDERTGGEEMTKTTGVARQEIHRLSVVADSFCLLRVSAAPREPLRLLLRLPSNQLASLT